MFIIIAVLEIKLRSHIRETSTIPLQTLIIF